MPAPGSESLARVRQERILLDLRTTGAVTVDALAEALDVSRMTIRRDLNSLAARALLTRVHGGATLLDHRGVFTSPAGAAAAPQRGARFTVGMIVPQLDYYWPTIIAGAREAAATAGARLILRTTAYEPQEDWRQSRRFAEAAGVDGLIVAPEVAAPQAGDLLRWLDSLSLPVVLVERRPPDVSPVQRLEWVASDHASGAAAAVWHLHQQGHRRIGLLVLAGNAIAPHLRRGWHDALLAVGLDPAEQLVGTSDGAVAPGRSDRLSAVLSECTRTGTTALVVHSDPFAVSLAQHATDSGLAIPDDLALVAYDDEVAELSEPPLTAVRPPKHDVGRLAVELMVARLTEGDRRPPHRVMIAPHLVVRASSVSLQHRHATA